MSQEFGGVDSDWDEERVTLGRNFVRDMEGLWSQVLRLAAVVEDSLDQSVHAFCDGCVELAEKFKGQKRAVDGWEVQIERECVRILALHQPVASDLRRVAVALKLNGDFVRLCALARHIAKRVKKLATDPAAFPIPQSLESLALGSLSQLHRSLDALTQSDVSQAMEVIASDRRIDRAYRAFQRELKEEIIRDPDRIDTWLRLVNTARNLERIADHASKIAESVIYLKKGEILRHRAVRATPY
jgi:phosphate transport system protein